MFRPLLPFALGAGRNSEPRRAICLTFALTLGVLFLAGGGGPSGKTFFNTVAAIVSMYFLLTYGMINVAAFVESFGGNPSFRPRFRFFNWAIALAGFLGCVSVSALINGVAAACAAVVMGTIYWILRKKVLKIAFGDSRRGFRFAQLRNRLYQLSRLSMHPKNWRPTMLVLSGNPNTRLALVQCAIWMEGGRGIVTLAEILVGEIEKLAELRKTGIRRLENFILENNLMAYPEVVVAEDFDVALPVLLQGHGIGPLKPNLLMLGWPSDPERTLPFACLLRTVAHLNMSIAVYADKAESILGSGPRIDLWCRGQKNGALMIILAHLMCEHNAWKDARLRILREIGDEAGREPTQQSLYELIHAARVEAEVVAVVSQEPFVEVLHDHFRDASLVILGLFIPPEDKETGFYENYTRLMEDMPPTLLVYSSGEADLFA